MHWLSLSPGPFRNKWVFLSFFQFSPFLFYMQFLKNLSLLFWDSYLSTLCLNFSIFRYLFEILCLFVNLSLLWIYICQYIKLCLFCFSSLTFLVFVSFQRIETHLKSFVYLFLHNTHCSSFTSHGWSRDPILETDQIRRDRHWRTGIWISFLIFHACP